MVVKGRKGTDGELSAKNLFIAQIWNLWAAPPIIQGALVYKFTARSLV